MAKLKKDLDKYIELREEDYLTLLKHQMMIEALIIAGIKAMPIYKAMRRIIDDKRLELHPYPINRRYSKLKD